MPIIKEIFAYIVADAGPEDEGVAAYLEGGIWRPMVGADMARAESLREMAQTIADQIEKPVELYLFSGRELVDTVYPRQGQSGR